MRYVALIATLWMVVAVSGCGGENGVGDPAQGGGSEAAASATATPGQTRRDGAAGNGVHGYTREQVVEALGLTAGHDRDGVPRSDPRSGCFAKKIFVTPDDNMEAYQQIGDPVATNPSEAVGAWVGTYEGQSERRCLRLFERRLAELE